MSRYENISRKPDSVAWEPGRVVNGSFACNHCDLVSDEAKFRPNERLLIWKCENGHVSYVEDFDLH